MSNLQFACPHCRGTFQAEPSMAGQQVACPSCGGQLMLPATSAARCEPASGQPSIGAATMTSPPPFSPRAPTPAVGGTGIVVRDTGKTKVVAGERVIELRRLSPEDKAARRFRRNVVMLVLGLSLLLAALLFLLRS